MVQKMMNYFHKRKKQAFSSIQLLSFSLYMKKAPGFFRAVFGRPQIDILYPPRLPVAMFLSSQATANLQTRKFAFNKYR